MMLAGLQVPNDDVRELARLVDGPTKSVLEKAIERQTTIVALTVPDREMILRALDDPQTTALAELRATLLLRTPVSTSSSVAAGPCGSASSSQRSTLR